MVDARELLIAEERRGVAGLRRAFSLSDSERSVMAEGDSDPRQD